MYVFPFKISGGFAKLHQWVALQFPRTVQMIEVFEDYCSIIISAYHMRHTLSVTFGGLPRWVSGKESASKAGDLG